jgi:hypothetical protein
MNSYQIVYHLETTTVVNVSGNCYVKAETSAKAKKIVDTYFRNNLSNIVSLTFDRAIQRTPDNDSLYVTPTSKFDIFPVKEESAEDTISWGYNKAPGNMPTCKKCHTKAVPNNFYGFWCPTCNAYPTF